MISAKRKITNHLAISVMALFSIIAIAPLASVFIWVAKKGISHLNFDLLFKLPKAMGEAGGGVANAMWGSTVVIGLAALIGIPWGIGCGILLSEYKFSKFTEITKFTIDLLLSVPSIVLGLFAYAVFVVPSGGFSGWAGSLALLFIFVPFVARTTEEVLKLVPHAVREAGMALGLSRRRVIFSIVLKAGRSGVLTGVLLGVARIAGETAPLLFTSFNNPYFANRLGEPMATLPVVLFNYATSPYEENHQIAWAIALFLVGVILAINIFIRIIWGRKS